MSSSSPPPPPESSDEYLDTSLLINIDLPVEMIEEILSYCPVKSVHRFKSVCKEWHSFISDPRFSKIHHNQRSKTHQNLYLIWAFNRLGKPGALSRLYSMSLELDGKSESRLESLLVGAPYIPDGAMISHCDGIFLLDGCICSTCRTEEGEHVLWNPSIRKGTIIRGYPRPRAYHLYYDATDHDYKIVFIIYSCYTVYSCRSRSWGKTRDLPCHLPQPVPVDGCFYQLYSDATLVCFDARDGKVDKFRQPDDVIIIKGGTLVLMEVSGRLCLQSLTQDSKRTQLWIMEKEKLHWRNLMSVEKEVEDLCFSRPVCLIDQDKVMLLLSSSSATAKGFAVVYDTRHKTFLKIYHDINRCTAQFFPFKENPYLPSSNILL